MTERTKAITAVVATVLLSAGLVLYATQSARATTELCPSYAPNGTAKIDTTGDPATITYTAPSGYLVDYYCVKAGTTAPVIQVDPPTSTVTIDHPVKDSVSHYSVHWIPAPRGNPTPEPTVTIPDPMPSFTAGPPVECFLPDGTWHPGPCGEVIPPVELAETGVDDGLAILWWSGVVFLVAAVVLMIVALKRKKGESNDAG